MAGRWEDYPGTLHELSVDNLNSATRSPSSNMIQNGGFKGWIDDLPSYWGRDDSDGTLTQDTTAAQGFSGGTALKWVQAASDAANSIVQDVFGIAPWRDGTAFNGVSFRAKVKTAAASFVRAEIRDSAGASTYGSYHTGGGGWEELTVSVRTGDDFSSGPLYVGLDVATVGSDSTFWADRVEAFGEQFCPGFSGKPDSVMWAAGGPLQSGWSRRNGSALSLLVSDDLAGVRDSTTAISYSPDFTTATGLASPNVVGAYFNPSTSGGNAWTTTNLRKVATWEVTSTQLILRAGGATTWAGGLTPGATILWLIEPTGGESPW